MRDEQLKNQKSRHFAGIFDSLVCVLVFWLGWVCLIPGLLVGYSVDKSTYCVMCLLSA
ncbi:hypothetical protein CLV80_1151 [Yoonia maritima]|uniref:Uncharacterized protein n=1 Tax=Yoonia maritima TaxID=1435347 RepID=A0A2T0VTX6_9RHOB|nr:hypothetical protein CLV80_1151 [Yoonia maritima]